MGTQTFGKGSVQTIMPLGNNTAIKLTTARYYTPSGRSIQAKGITPDIIVEEPGQASARVREADLQRHLANGEAGQPRKPATTDKPAAQPAVPPEQQKPIEFGSKDDFLLQQALAHLKGEPVQGQQPAVAQTGKPAAKSKAN
jgi:carboxyl-terminal processing protease